MNPSELAALLAERKRLDPDAPDMVAMRPDTPIPMPYIVGIDPEADELIVGDRRTNSFFLRGSRMSEREIRDFVQAANMWLSRPIPEDTEKRKQREPEGSTEPVE